MCAASYQRENVSMDDGSSDDNDMYKRDCHDSLEVPKKRRLCLSVGMLVGLVMVVVLCALLIPKGQSNEPAFIKDDGAFANTDDDSIFYHGEIEVQDPKIIILDDSGAKNIEHLSKATAKSGNIMAGCETTILLMRHCEKFGDDTVDEDGNEHCDYVGFERTHWIPSLFGDNARWPSPSYLFALSPTRESHNTFREVETLIPLAEKFGLPIHKEFSTNNEVIHEIFKHMSNGETCGKVMVVNWRHHMMPNLARKLGCKSCPKEYPDDSFDQVWQLKLVWDVPSTAVHQQNSSALQTLGPSSPQLRRGLRKHKKAKDEAVDGTKQAKNPYEGPLWSVYSTITYQNFDPLQFSGSVGDYHRNGTEVGASWLNFEDGEM